MSYRLIVAAAVLSLSSACATAQGPQLTLPEFSHLQDKATESVDVTLGSFPITMARWFISDSDPDGAAVKDLLKNVKSVKVRHFEFADDFVYEKADLDSVRSQLTGKGWSSLAQVRDNKKNEDVDIFVAMNKDEIAGFAIVQSAPREFTIVNVVGTLDMKQVQALRAQLEKSGRLSSTASIL